MSGQKSRRSFVFFFDVHTDTQSEEEACEQFVCVCVCVQHGDQSMCEQAQGECKSVYTPRVGRRMTGEGERGREADQTPSLFWSAAPSPHFSIVCSIKELSLVICVGGDFISFYSIIANYPQRIYLILTTDHNNSSFVNRFLFLIFSFSYLDTYDWWFVLYSK